MHMRPLGETIGLLEAGGFEVRGVQALREHYVRTGTEWLAHLEARWRRRGRVGGEEVAACGASYLVGGGLAFEERRMGVDQILVRSPIATAERVRHRRVLRDGGGQRRRGPGPDPRHLVRRVVRSDAST